MCESADEFEVVDVVVQTKPLSQSQAPDSSLLDFVDVLPSTKLSDAHKATLKTFLVAQELTMDDFTTDLSEDNFRELFLRNPPIPLGPLFRFLDAIAKHRHIYHACNKELHSNDDRRQWTQSQVIQWINAQSLNEHTSMYDAVMVFNITGHTLFDQDAFQQFRDNAQIPSNIRKQFVHLVERESKSGEIEVGTEEKASGEESPATEIFVPVEPVVGHMRRWYWFNDSHGFIRFEDATSDQISKAFASGLERLELTAGKFFAAKAPKRYEISFDRAHPEGPHLQRNTFTLEARAVISHRHEFISSKLHGSLVHNKPRSCEWI